MNDITPVPKPWLVAAWPGMGNVALVAAGYLVRTLELQPFAEVAARPWFDVTDVGVKKGIIAPPRAPRSVLFRSTKPVEGRPLIVFMGEAQPSGGTLDYARQIVEKAADLGVERIVTFASMAAHVHPEQEPRVFAAATTHDALSDLRAQGHAGVEDGQISGLNGVLLGAAAEKNMEGICLLGQIPAFAPNVVNPKAARAILDAFIPMADLKIDTAELAEQARPVEEFMTRLLDQMSPEQRAMALGEHEDADDDDGDEGVPDADFTPGEAESDIPPSSTVTDADRERIERLFAEAQRDRASAAMLKAELDRLGVFREHEGRFLDLFKPAA